MFNFRVSRHTANVILPVKTKHSPPQIDTADTSIKNLIVWIKQNFDAKHDSTYVFKKEEDMNIVLGYLRSQVDNSLRIGWKPSNLFIVTNFPFAHRGVEAIPLVDIYEDCSFVNKWTALNMLWNMGVRGDFWYHDADAFQLSQFNFPTESKDIGFVRYRKGVQGGSVFFRKKGQDLLTHLIQQCKERKVANDEDVFWTMAYDKVMGQRISWLNTTYNVGRTNFWSRYNNAEKPIKVLHIKPHEKWHRHRNTSLNAFATPLGLQEILKRNGIWNKAN